MTTSLQDARMAVDRGCRPPGGGETVPILKRLKLWTVALLSERTRAEPLAAMRIGVSLLWLYELVQLVPWRSYLYPGVRGSGLLLAVWIVATVCLLVGFRPRVAAFVSLLCFFRFVSFGTLYFRAEAYAQLAAFYLVFLDSGRCWSVDAILRRRTGAHQNRDVLALPAYIYLLHLGLSYFDVGWAHLLRNASWREGFAVSQSFLLPSAGSQLGGALAEISTLPRLLTWLTMVYEIGFVFIVVAWLVNRRRTFLLTALGIAGVSFHLGITLFYRLGIFGPLMMAMMLPLLPIRSGQATAELPRAAAPSRAVRLGLVGATVVLLLALITSAPVLYAADRARINIVSVGLPKTYGLLGLTGDHRPNDIFAELITSIAFSIETEAWSSRGQPIVWPLLFDSYGRRAGATEFYPVFSYWLVLARPLAVRSLSGLPFPPGWEARFRRGLTPVIERSDNLRNAARVEVFFRAWKVPRTPSRAGTVQALPRVHLASVSLAHGKVVAYDFDPL